VGRRGYALLRYVAPISWMLMDWLGGKTRTDWNRIAAKFGSPRYTADAAGLYALLRGAETLEAEGISSTLVLWQDKVKYEHEVSKGDLHIEEEAGTLKIYIPHDKAAWDECFLDALPLRLASWLMAPSAVPDAAVGVVMSILTCSETAIPPLLKRKGVPEIPEVEEPLPELLEVQDDSDDLTHGVADAVDTVTVTSVSAALHRSNGIRDGNILPAGLGHSFNNGGDMSLEAPLQVHLSEAQLAADREKYRQLLDSVIAMAAKVAQRDYDSATDLSGAFGALALAETTKFRSYLSNTPDRDRKVGAAGELFVSPFSLTPLTPTPAPSIHPLPDTNPRPRRFLNSFPISCPLWMRPPAGPAPSGIMRVHTQTMPT